MPAQPHPPPPSNLPLTLHTHTLTPPPPLQGWEAKYDKQTKRIFYVDHNSRTTTWERPTWAAGAAGGSGSPTPRTPRNILEESLDSFAAGSGEPLTPWCMMDASVERFGKRILPDALAAMAELFLVNGDMCAFLYTGSAAMHSDKLLVFEPEGSKLRKAGAGAYGNSLIAIKRR